MTDPTKNVSDISPYPRKKTNFAADVLTLMSGTTIAQILCILATPILTRFYDPEDFGLLALFISITGIFGIISCLRYELSIMLPKSDDEAVNLLGLSLLISLIISFISLPIIWFCRETIVVLLKTPQLGAYLWFIPFYVFINGAFLALNGWNSRTKHFWRLSIARITSSVASTGIQLGSGFKGFATGGTLIGANIVGQSISTLILGGQIWRNDHTIFKRSICWEKMISGLKRYRKFPLVDSWSALLNTVSWQLPIFLLAYFFSPAVVGFYSLGFRLLELPMSFIGSSISQVFFQRASEAKSEGTLASLVENVFRLLVIIGTFPILTLTLVSSNIFTVIFGSNWIEAGYYVQILSVWAFLWFISSPISTLWIILEKQEFGFRITFLNFITRFLSIYLGGLLNNVYIALLLFSLSGVFVYGYLCTKMMIMSGIKFYIIRNIFVSNVIISAPFLLLLIVAKVFIVNQQILVCISFLLISFYYLYIFKTDPQIGNLLQESKIKIIH